MITIIIPIFNSEKYIDRCISSVLNQSLIDIEIIIVNDGSTDNSLYLCKEWERRDNRIKLLSQKNSGVSAARNLGIRNATGDYIIFLDSDDYMYPSMCETMYRVLIEKEADCVICGAKETGGGVWSPFRNIDYKSLSEFKKDFIYQLGTELLSPCWNKIFKKELITDYFDENVSFGEDLIFCLDYIKKCTVVSFITDILIFHEKNVSGSLVSKVDLKRLLDIETVHEKTIEFCDDLPKELHNKYIRDITVYLRMFFLNSTMGFEEKKLELNKWMKNSYIRKINIWTISSCMSNKLLLLLSKYKIWRIINMLVNIK